MLDGRMPDNTMLASHALFNGDENYAAAMATPGDGGMVAQAQDSYMDAGGAGAYANQPDATAAQQTYEQQWAEYK